jgi:hypothetical protein
MCLQVLHRCLGEVIRVVYFFTSHMTLSLHLSKSTFRIQIIVTNLEDTQSMIDTTKINGFCQLYFHIFANSIFIASS